MHFILTEGLKVYTLKYPYICQKKVQTKIICKKLFIVFILFFSLKYTNSTEDIWYIALSTNRYGICVFLWKPDPKHSCIHVKEVIVYCC